MRRRRVLQSLSMVGLWSLAGCNGNSETSTRSTTAPEETTSSTTLGPYDVEGVIEFPTTAPKVDAECGDDVLEPVRAPRPPDEEHVQAANGLEMTASTERVAIGEEITFSLRNTTSEIIEVGNYHKYNIHRRGDEGWEWIFQTPEKAWYDDVDRLLPGAGFDWPFTFTQEGLERNHAPGGVSYLVCSPLEPGTYRFVYFGAFDTPIGTEFTVETT